MSSMEDVSQFAAQNVSIPDVKPAAPQGPELLAGRFDLIGGLKVRVEARLGGAEISVEELFSLRENSTVALEAAPTDPIELLLDGKLVARGTLVVIGDSFGVRITDVPKNTDK